MQFSHSSGLEAPRRHEGKPRLKRFNVPDELETLASGEGQMSLPNANEFKSVPQSGGSDRETAILRITETRYSKDREIYQRLFLSAANVQFIKKYRNSKFDGFGRNTAVTSLLLERKTDGFEISAEWLEKK